MSFYRPRVGTVVLAAFALLLMAVIPVVLAQGGDTSRDDARKAKVKALSALSAKERKAELQKLTATERRSLWFELKKDQAMARGQQPLKAGSGLKATARTGHAQNAVERAVGSIVYDDGVITNSFGGGAIIGNRFNTATGNPLMVSGTVSTVVGVVVQGPAFTTSSAGFVIEGPQTGGGGAFAIFSTFTGATGVTDTVTFAGLGASYTGSSFFVLFGDFANSYVPAFGTGSTQSQGHHGVVGYTGGMGPNITSTFDFGGTLNGLVRVTGNVLPVELMSFDVE
ncbi:MAG: hypothetical protein KDD11_12795 [Acidobacteria bacterium]|nr:hypothetical protein [Acidobacteriota bacterium]